MKRKVWFPAPETTSPAVREMLIAEEEYLTANWTLWKVLMALLVPVSFAALGLAFWRRSLVWGLAEPLDQRVLRCDYSDVALLGKAVTRGPRWRLAGFALHALNGAVFGLVFHEVRGRVPLRPKRLAVAMALAEHAMLYPLCGLVDRYHPARGGPGVPPLLTNPRAFAQATWRHLLFGAVLGAAAGD